MLRIKTTDPARIRRSVKDVHIFNHYAFNLSPLLCRWPVAALHNIQINQIRHLICIATSDFLVLHRNITKRDIFHRSIIPIVHGDHRLMKIIQYRDFGKRNICYRRIRLIALVCLISNFHRLCKICPDLYLRKLNITAALIVVFHNKRIIPASHEAILYFVILAGLQADAVTVRSGGNDFYTVDDAIRGIVRLTCPCIRIQYDNVFNCNIRTMIKLKRNTCALSLPACQIRTV